MILECHQCKRLYDASGMERGTAIACECGDTLIVPEVEMMEGKVLIDNYMKRLAEEESLELAQIAKGDRWEMQRGSARIQMQYDTEEDLLTIESPIMPLPDDEKLRPPLFQRILELNHRSTGEARFAVHNGQVVVTFTRSAVALDYVEFHTAVESVCRTADDYDDELRAEFLPREIVEEGDEEIDLTGESV